MFDLGIADFLLARYAEDEAAAQAVDTVTDQIVTAPGKHGGLRWGSQTFPIPDHYRRWNARRVEGMVGALREVVALHADCGECSTLRALATAHRGHPDYRWRDPVVADD